MLYGAGMAIVGFQAVLFAVHSKVFAISEGLLPRDKKMDWICERFYLETGLVFGGLLLLAGIVGTIIATRQWQLQEFGSLEPRQTMRVAIVSVTLFALGFQTCLASFFLSILGLKRKAQKIA
jgi:hypothetical protein